MMKLTPVKKRIIFKTLVSGLSTTAESVKLAKTLNVPKEYIYEVLTVTNHNIDLISMRLERDLPLSKGLKEWYAKHLKMSKNNYNKSKNFNGVW